MPYKIERRAGYYRIRTPHGLLRGHYQSKESAQNTVRYLYARESPGFRGGKTVRRRKR
jgi:hypothetical protein